MKLLTFKYNGNEKVGILLDNYKIYPISDSGLNYKTMNELIENITDEKIEILKTSTKNIKSLINFSEIQKMAPIPVPKQDIICLGVNYVDHAIESAKFKKELYDEKRQYPVYFSKRVNEAVADSGIIESYPGFISSLDYEVELGVIIKKDAKNVPKDKAFDYVLGYTIINDISARDIQTRHNQWYFGKSLDTFLPMGPWIVTADEFDKPPKLKISSKVNGELRQNSSTDLLIFPIDYVISELSCGMTLKAGTIIAMGTPAGVGMGFNPPKFLKSGDIVECEIEGIGCLKNIVR